MENEKNPLGEEAVSTPEAEETAPETSEKPTEKELSRELAELREELKKKEEDGAALSDKYLRMMAEYDNFRRRSAKEREGVYTDAVSDVIGMLLPIADNLERAVQFGSADPDKVAEGLSMVSKSLAEMLEKLGVALFGEAGETFDPNLHNAIMHVEDEEHGEGEILEVFQRGYRKGDRIIRYAMVKVAN